MAATRFEERLIDRAGLGDEPVRQAHLRKAIYGGAFDTILLELGLVDEATVREVLKEETSLDPAPPALLNEPVVSPEMLVSLAEAKRMGALVFSVEVEQGPSLQILVRHGFDVAALAQTIGDRRADVLIVPEVRFEALLGAYYDQPIPPRFLSLLGRLMGPEKARQWALRRRRPRSRIPSPPVDVGPMPNRPEPVAPPQPKLAPPPPAAPKLPPTPTPTPTPTPPPPESDPLESVEVEVEVEVDEPLPASTRAPLSTFRQAYLEQAGGPRGASLRRTILEQFSIAELIAELPVVEAQNPEDPFGGKATRTWLELAVGATDAPKHIAALLARPEPRWRYWGATGIECAPELHLTAEAASRLCALYNGEPSSEVKTALVGALKRFVKLEPVRELAARLQDEVASADGRIAEAAVSALMRLRDPAAFHTYVDALGRGVPSVQKAAHRALLVLTAHDLGVGAAVWTRWWKKNSAQDRIEWLLDGLSSRKPELRLIAIEELENATRQRLGYHFDLPTHERKQAVQRWRAWWDEHNALDRRV
jgi:hypothetical protein